MARKRATAPSIEADVLDKIILLVVSLQSRAAVKAACVEKLNLPADQADAAIDLARERIRDAVDVDREERKGEAIVRLNDLFERALRVQDVKAALQAQKELNRLLGLCPTKASPSTGNGKESRKARGPLAGLKVTG